MTTATQTESVRQSTTDLVEQFQQKASLLSPKELFRLGGILHQLDALQAERVKHDVQSAYHQLLEQLPQKRRFFDVLLQGLDRLLLQSSSSSSSDVLSAVHAMDSLYQFSVLAEASHASTATSIKSLAHYHATCAQPPTDILSLIFRLLWQSPSHVSLEWEELLPVLETLHERNVWKPLARYLDEIHFGWKEAWLDGYADETQREYLTTWLQSAESDENEQAEKLAQAIARAKPSPKVLRPKKVAAPSSVDPLQRQLDQVRAILPQYGEGLVELALSVRQGSVEETVSLLSSPAAEWPAALRSVDPSLPRRHQKRVANQDADVTQRTKENIRLADAQQEAEAQILTQFTATMGDEYDDDYDDQWDAVDTAGANDGGLYDDFQAVRTYNRIVRDEEKEAAFWQANANTNRRGTKPSSGEPKYRGPDKTKGGRVPKPGTNKEKEKEETKAEAEANNAKKEGGNPKEGGTTKPLTQQDGKPSKAAQRQKERKMANRRGKQRQAMNKRGS